MVQLKKTNTKHQYRYCIMVCLFLVVMLIAMYFQIKNFGVINNDDIITISDIKYALNASPPLPLSLIWKTPDNRQYWAPISLLSYGFDKFIFGKNVYLYCLTNILLHIAASITLFLLCKYSSKSFWKSALVASLFALHSLNTDSIATFYGRTNILSGFLGITSLLAYAYYTKAPNLKKYLLFLVLLLTTLMTKPTMLIFIAILPLIDYWPLDRLFEKKGYTQIYWKDIVLHPYRAFNKTALIDKIPFIVLGAGSFLFTIINFSKTEFPALLASFEPAKPWFSMLPHIPIACCTYLWKVVYPVGLPAYVSPTYFGPTPVLLSLFSAGILLCISIAAIRMAKTHPYFITGWLWFLSGLLPHLIIVVSQQRLIIERYAYIPAIGLFIIIVWGGTDLLTRLGLKKSMITAIALILLSFNIVVTWYQTKHWQSALSYYTHAVRLFPENSKAHLNLGELFMREGQDDKAMKHFHTALQVDPDNAVAHSHMANTLVVNNQPQKALFHYRRALQLKPDYAAAHGNMANLLMDMGKIDKAIKHYKAALNINPRLYVMHNNLATAFINKGEVAMAARHLDKALEIKPDYQTALQNKNSLNMLSQ